MSDNNTVTFENGDEYVIDTNKMTIVEFRELFKEGTDEKYGDKILARCIGKPIEFVQSLGHDDYQLLSARFWKVVQRKQQPDPN